MVRMWKIATNEKQKVKFVKRKVWGKKVEMKMRWWKVEGFPTAEDWKLCCDPVAMLNGNYHRKSQFIAFIETDHYSNYFDNHKNMVKLEQVCFNENKFSFHMTHEKLSRAFPHIRSFPFACYFQSHAFIASIPRETWHGKNCELRNFINFSQKKSSRLFKPVFVGLLSQLISEKSIKIS